MKPTLTIETGIEPEYEDALQHAARIEGWLVERVANIPFTDSFVDRHNDPLPDNLLQNSRVWFHGSIQAAKRAQQVTKWQVHAPWEQLRCSNYYPMLRAHILQQEHQFTTIGDLPAQKDALYASHMAQDDTLFFRPDGNDKEFTGGCISHAEFQQGYALMTSYNPPPTISIVVARPQRILAEARFIVVSGKLITGSFYRTGSQIIRLEAQASLIEIAADHLAFCLKQGFNPAPSWVLDLAQTSAGWSIIEVGASSCCGLYKCDMPKFVKALAPLI